MKVIKDSNSLLAKYLTTELYDKLKWLKTKNWFTIDDLIKSNLVNKDSSIGIYAFDADSYEVFKDIFYPIIKEYHNYDFSKAHIFDFDYKKLNFENDKLFDKYILSTRIRTARNFANFPFGAWQNKQQRLYIENIMKEIFKDFDWTYFSLKDLSDSEKNKLVQEHILYKDNDRFMEAVWLMNDWPEWRGIFISSDKTFIVWVNEEDELRLIAMEKWWDIKSVFRKLEFWVKEIENHIKNIFVDWQALSFAKDEKLWYLTSCPTNIWNGIRASVHIKLENLWKNPKILEDIASKYFLQIRWEYGEHSESKNYIYDISNKRRLWLSEVDAINDLYNWIKEIINMEEKLSFKK